MQPSPRNLRPLRRGSRSRFSLAALKKPQNVNFLLRSAVIGVISLFLLGMLVFAWFSRDLPSPGEIQSRSGFSTQFLDKNDEVMFEMFEDKNRIPVGIEDIPETLKQATIAVEDKNFYSHGGFSVWSIFRSVVKSALTGSRLAGGSTLTQQLVKNVLLSQERSFVRKIKEVMLAVSIERRYTKDEILEMYLNESPYGGTFWGVQSAAKGYFDKDAKELNLIESAIIAGLPQSPSRYSPISGEKDAFKGRTRSVLRRMREDDYITKAQEEKALKDLEKVKFKKNALAIQAPHFVFYVRDLIAAQFGAKLLDEGIKVKTTLDLKIQKEAQKITATEIEKIKAFKATNGAVVAIDSQTGHILAMVGSYDYSDEEFGSYNVTTAKRQPGSSVKPFTYATALAQGYTPASIVMDVETEFPNQGDKSYIPGNYDGKFRGPVNYRRALANSHNIPAVKVLAQVGIRSMMQTAYDMGIRSFEPTDANIKRFGLAITLGGGETTLLDLTNAFSTFARGGKHVEPIAILEIRDHKNKLIYKAKEPKPEQVISEDVAFLISHMLSDNNARSETFGTGSYLNVPGKTVAVKTGTTNNLRDNWTVGYTNSVTVGTWVGNNNNTPMNAKIASGVTGASPIWNGVMRAFLNNDYEDGIMEVPENVEALQVDALLGGLPRDGQPTRSEYFIKGTEPTEQSPYYQKVKVSKNDGDKLANDIEIKSGEFIEKDYIVIQEEDPISTDGKNRWQEGINKWASEQADSRYKVPTSTSDSKSDEISVSIKDPDDKKRYDNGKIKVRATVTSIESIKKVRLIVNGETVKEWNESKKSIEEELDLGDGIYEIKVRAENSKGKSKESRVRIGVNKDWDDTGDPEPTVEPTPTPTPVITLP
jgi:1A family penicillin-binding protein